MTIRRDIADILDDDPITLGEASAILLRGVVSVSALRSEVRRGNLAVEWIGKNHFTTPADIRDMRLRCRVKPSPRVSTSEGTGDNLSGSSATKAAIDEQAALKAIAKALKKGVPLRP